MELQPRQTFFMPYVQPGQEAKNMRLSGGVTEPYYYSLSSRSTVPYVEISGGTKSNKLLSWGEVIMVPPGEMLTVKNASYHQGDIAINSGQDWVEAPTRVTVPVPLNLTVVGLSLFIKTAFPVDCRRAKRAYATIDILLGALTPIAVVNKWRESSFNTTVAGYGGAPANPIFAEIVTIPAFTKFGLFPLGKMAADTITPMTLGDTAEFSYTIAPGTELGGVRSECFYTLEY
jgi:hypothetical protein